MNSTRIKECIGLSADILKNFELSEIPVSNVILKCLRLCRLLGDEDGILLFSYESSGYPKSMDGLMTKDALRISEIAGRRHHEKRVGDSKSDLEEYTIFELLAEIDETIIAQKLRLSAAADPNISLSSSNPRQYVSRPMSNSYERNGAVASIKYNQKWKQIITGNLYTYILKIYNKLAYGNIIEDTFTKSRLSVNDKLSALCPKAIEKFVAVL